MGIRSSGKNKLYSLFKTELSENDTGYIPAQPYDTKAWI